MPRDQRTLRMIIAGGGTGGHVLPAVAVIEELRARGVDLDALWIGSAQGIEREQAIRLGVPFRTIRTGKLRRYFDLRTIPDAVKIPIGTVQAYRAIRRFRPEIIFSTGGFVSVPSVVAGSRMAPVLTHEQTAIIGLANRINLRFAHHVALSFDETARRLEHGSGRVTVTGNPIRQSLFAGDAGRGRAHFGLDPALPLVLVTGGARGASPLNARIEAILPTLLERCQIVHQTGPASANEDFVRLRSRAEALPESLKGRYVVVEFLGEEIADVLAAASLVVCRAGAGTVAELAALGKPALLIPLPDAGGHEQHLNARMLADAGAGILLDQSEASPERMVAEIVGLLERPDRLAEMAARARAQGRPEAAAALTDLILQLAWGEPQPASPVNATRTASASVRTGTSSMPPTGGSERPA